MILEIGTGKGKRSKFQDFDNFVHVDIDKSAQHLEVQCDALSLPFRPKIFNETYPAHVMEHLENTVLFLSEIKRVTRYRLIIKVPNASFYKFMSSDKTHIFSWNQFTLKNLLDKYFGHVVIRFTKRNSISNKFLRFCYNFTCLVFQNNELTAYVEIGQ